ncbi:mannonate dehydratase [Flavobacterium sp. UMI-01]|uniref:mannonate dehydratase n=1 Tax=Flavobacterium sp. UMI-01 TaxID=1441053 RepID=UPI001C7D7B29|nr:mannonate dehydratase [Flavobacterium sp. UMI-01]GIZ09597.1 mannonate dehydratase [Flavobacterium sp. UMI-01]
MLQKTWRWFGPKDTVTLKEIKQFGVEGIVTALHHIPNGEIWTMEEILKTKSEIESYGMQWSVVESLPVSEGIKTANYDRERLIQHYKISLENLGKCGINTVCYNFMPVLDWVRTDIHYKFADGAETMYFNYPTFAAFDIYILKRPRAANDYPAEIIKKAENIINSLSPEDQEKIAHSIIVLTQGFIDGAVSSDAANYKELFLSFLDNYKNINAAQLRKNLTSFLNDIMPTADSYGIKMCIHPDDPPFSVLGLPRIVSTQEDVEWILKQYDSINNGITFCSGSLAVRKENNFKNIVKSIADRIHFVHLRSTQREDNYSFYEAHHLEGCVDMYSLIKDLLLEQQRRKKEGRLDFKIPFRPDHGIKIGDDFNRKSNPGYPLIGRLKGLSELSGMMTAIERSLKEN